MLFLEDKSGEDAARALNVHPSTVSRHLTEALRMLRRYLIANGRHPR